MQTEFNEIANYPYAKKIKAEISGRLLKWIQIITIVVFVILFRLTPDGYFHYFVTNYGFRFLLVIG